MLGQRRRQWYNIQSTEKQVDVFTWPSECVSISQTNIYPYKSTKAQWGLLIDEIWRPNSEVWNLKFQFKMAAKNPWKKFQKIPIKITQHNLKPSSNIIVTWKVTILFWLTLKVLLTSTAVFTPLMCPSNKKICRTKFMSIKFAGLAYILIQIVHECE